MRSLFWLFWAVSIWTISLLLPLRATSALTTQNLNPMSFMFHQVMIMTLPSPIFQRWLHSREEDQADVLVYRPYDYPLPPARGREGLEFRENGEFIRYQIAPTDRSAAVTGQWQMAGTHTVQIQFPDQPTYSIIILECSPEVLKLKQMAATR